MVVELLILIAIGIAGLDIYLDRTACPMPEMIGTYEDPKPYHEGCKKKYSDQHCASKVEFIESKNHYNVRCKKK